MQVAVFVAGVTAALTTFTKSYNQLLACFVAYAIADEAIVSSMNIFTMATLSPKQRSQGFGFFHFCLAIALAVGPPFGGEWISVQLVTEYICLPAYVQANLLSLSLEL